MNDIFFEDISSLSQLINTKKISPVELVTAMLERISKVDPALNSFIKVLSDSALEDAKQLEAEVVQGKSRGPLHGVPIAVKDILATAGIETTSGSKLFENWKPDGDATAIRKLKEAGAIIIGKANLHEFAMGATTENPHYGVCRNPWDVSRIPGGSSGGSAVAVAAGMSFGALGTDTAGSIRLPAALCGIVGIKPTYGRVSRHGCLPFSWSLDHIGPMTRTVKDSAIMLDAIAGYDRLDYTTSKRPNDVLFSEIANLKGVKLAVVKEHFFEDVDPEVCAIVQKAIADLKALGADVLELELDGLGDVLQSLRVIAQSEVVAFHEPLLKKYKHLYGEDLQFRFNFGKSISATDYINAQRTRNVFIQHLTEKMAAYGVDAIVAPTNVKPPISIGSVPPEEAINNMFTMGRTPFANIVGFPALTVPCGFVSAKLPVGLQLIGTPFAERKLFEIGHAYETSQNWIQELVSNKVYLEKLA
ncbi:amidase [Bacillus sp. Marseille-P3661]|uniref:amidase n=1 Tax=Bacillus sp. Marseille-P3661 TaxID=1936234 RepID=UPI000C81C256|nr:amidase [Bacillus sp. Marseille-P3661]